MKETKIESKDHIKKEPTENSMIEKAKTDQTTIEEVFNPKQLNYNYFLILFKYIIFYM